MSAVLDIEGLCYRYPERAGERGVEVRLDALSLAPAARLAVVGPSGCGKTTLLDMIGLILPPTAVDRFRLRLPDEAPRDLADILRSGGVDDLAAVRGRALGHVLQQGGLLDFLSVAENIALTARAGRDDTVALAGALGLGDLLGRLPAALSAGQRQRVAIARALNARPALLVADEPTAALDPETAGRVMRLFVETARERGTALVVASHDRALLERHGFALLEGHSAVAEDVTVCRFAERVAA